MPMFVERLQGHGGRALGLSLEASGEELTWSLGYLSSYGF